VPLVEQSTLKRRGTGLRAYDPDGAFTGYTLFTPNAGNGMVYLVDMQGTPVHTWRLPYRAGLYAFLTDAGRLFYCGKHDAAPPYPGFWGYQGGVVLEADWDGNILWEVRHPTHHHDARPLLNGNVALLCAAPIPADLAAQVQGGRAGTESDGVMWGDTLVEMTRTGAIVWEWRSWEHLDPATERITPQDERHEWGHANSVAELPDRNLVVSFRNISTVVIVDRASGAIIWKLGAPPLAQQHDARPLPNGHLLMFDNGTHRLDTGNTYSRVLEVDPVTSEIVWSYVDPTMYAFYSSHISGAQRLPNGNTLICEGRTGRLFEVTAGGEVVWEYVNPHFFPTPRISTAPPPVELPPHQVPGHRVQVENNSVFRAFRYSADEVERARTMADT
jgi:hypothetical protein